MRTVGGKALDGGYGRVGRGRDRSQPGSYRLTFEVHGACAALSDAAAVFRAAQFQDVPQHPEQRSVSLKIQRMFDAVYLACQEKLKAETGRKVLIMISDGDDNLSLETLSGTLEMAQKSDVSIFTISTNSSGFYGIAAPKTDKVLKQLAEDTGGRAFFPFKAEDLSESFQHISAELRSQYSVAYRSSNPARDGSFRSIKIETDRKNLKVKSRKGYYAARG
jgi:VWFA-related protein